MITEEELSYTCTSCGYTSKFCKSFPQKWKENSKGYFCPDCKNKKANNND